ncbi:MAG: hypothetical protein RI894_2144 [Bacteroidota bacterium]|jgi:hypothetical protein
MQTLKINPLWILFFMALFAIVTLGVIYFLKQIWFIGMVLSPIILLIAFFIHKETVLAHFKTIGDEFWKNPIRGLFSAVLSFAALPIVSIYILLKAIFHNKIGEMQQKNPFEMFGNQEQEVRDEQITREKKNPSVGEYIDYEEVE